VIARQGTWRSGRFKLVGSVGVLPEGARRAACARKRDHPAVRDGRPRSHHPPPGPTPQPWSAARAAVRRVPEPGNGDQPRTDAVIERGILPNQPGNSTTWLGKSSTVWLPAPRLSMDVVSGSVPGSVPGSRPSRPESSTWQRRSANEDRPVLSHSLRRQPIQAITIPPTIRPQKADPMPSTTIPEATTRKVTIAATR